MELARRTKHNGFHHAATEEMNTSSCGSFGGFPGPIYQEKRQVIFPASQSEFNQ